ncbi:MAG: 16S rRNA (cytosine(1402)-N(4))-methyltransferase, partial [Planctomycetes bacterium]|nr:16S rRNA (cytosine(1402)-N(4))-methyltransferase [Planctomycetota bacterium]
MARPVLELLDPAPGQVVLDCTAGRGGHASMLAKAVGPRGTVVLLDLDASNLAFARDRIGSMEDPPRVIAEHANFSQAATVLGRHGLRADVVLADLGFASTQMDDPLRGMAFSTNGPLDMRLDMSQPMTAEALLQQVDERELADLIFELGEDPFARRIARSIMERRQEGRLRSTGDLAEAVVRAYGARARNSRVHPATRTFMAIRIAVNRELESLDTLLSDFGRSIASMAQGGASVLAPGARIAFLAFHSLEDRSIKRTFVDW